MKERARQEIGWPFPGNIFDQEFNRLEPLMLILYSLLHYWLNSDHISMDKTGRDTSSFSALMIGFTGL